MDITTVKPAEIIRYIKDHPNCNRRDLYEHFLGMVGKDDVSDAVKSDLKNRISNRLYGLVKDGKVIENDIERSKSGNQITSSKLNLPATASIYPDTKQTGLKISQSEKSNENKNSQNERNEEPKLSQVEESIIDFITLSQPPRTNEEIARETAIPYSTVCRHTNSLCDKGYIKKDGKGWNPTDKAQDDFRRRMPVTHLYQTLPNDNFFFNIPILIENAGEDISENDIAQRAYGYEGFYQKYGVEEEEAQEDFLKKIRKHLESESLRNNFIHKDRYLWKVTESEEQLRLWRLWVMLGTVLFKSSSRRQLGYAVWMYKPLQELMKKVWDTVELKIKGLPEDERYVVRLMANGVQLENILPKDKADIFRDKLRLLDIPIRVYNAGTDKETTLIEFQEETAKKHDVTSAVLSRMISDIAGEII